MLHPVIIRLKELRSDVTRCDHNFASGLAYLIRLSDEVTKHGDLDDGTMVHMMMTPEWYIDVLSGARIAPVSIVSDGASMPENAALSLEVTEVTPG